MRVVVGTLTFALGLAIGLFARESAPPERSTRRGDAADRAVSPPEDAPAAPPPIEMPSGDGAFHGRVVVEGTDQPVADVLVVATPEWEPHAPAATRTPAGPEIDAHLEGWIAQARWMKAARRTTRTGDDGRFSLGGLARRSHVVRAYREGYEFRAHGIDGNTAEPDAEIEFRARRVVRVAIVTQGASGVPNLHVVIRGRTSRNEPLRLDDPVVEIEPGAYTFQLLGGQALEYESETLAVDVTDAANQSVTLVLVAQPTLQGRISIAQGLALPDQCSVNCVAVGTRTKPPTAREFMLSLHDDVAENGTYRIRDLEPGDYFVGVQCGTERIHYLARVSVEGITTHDIELVGPDPAECVLVRAFGPDGSVPRDWRATLHVQQPERSITGGSIQWSRTDGSRLVELPNWNREWGEIDERTRFEVQVTVPGLGELRRPCVLGGSADVRFRDPAELRVEVSGYDDHEEPGALAVTVRQGTRVIQWWAPLTSEGAVAWSGLQPDETRLTLTLHRSLVLEERSVELKPGSNVIRLSIPALHALRVEVPGVDRGVVWVRMGEHNEHQASLDSSGVAELELPAGEYEIGYANQRRAKVRVPTDRSVTLR